LPAVAVGVGAGGHHSIIGPCVTSVRVTFLIVHFCYTW
jgi:hypothetical protein